MTREAERLLQAFGLIKRLSKRDAEDVWRAAHPRTSIVVARQMRVPINQVLAVSAPDRVAE